MQHLDQTLQNKLTHNIVHVYPQLYLQACQHCLVSADTHRNNILETSGMIEPKQTNTMCTQTISESSNMDTSSISPLGQTLHNLDQTVQTKLTNNVDDVYTKPQLHSEAFILVCYLALADTFRNESLETSYVEPNTLMKWSPKQLRKA